MSNKTNQTELVTKKNRREGKGIVIALSRRIYKIKNSDVFYVESESRDGDFYYVMYDESVKKNYKYCSCKDFDRREVEKCKHIHAVIYAIENNLVVETDELPKSKKETSCNVQVLPYTEDDYSF